MGYLRGRPVYYIKNPHRLQRRKAVFYRQRNLLVRAGHPALHPHKLQKIGAHLLQQGQKFLPLFASGVFLQAAQQLKLLADVGLVGYPNVGKSTLISVVSGAKPVIANYHFTTLTPVLGVVKVAEEKSFVMADIPGLIEGASDGVGLGHEFLRHVERCRLIVHVVDVSGSEYRDPKEDFKTINRELANFSEELSKRDQIVVANKSDIATEEQIADFRQFVEEQGYPFFCISAATRKGIEPLVYAISQKLDELPPIKRFEVNYVPVMPESGEDKWKFEIHVDEDGVYVVEADWLVKVLGMVNLEDEESLGYFQRVLRQSGIIDKLEEMGINEGDTVSILNFEFDYLR